MRRWIWIPFALGGVVAVIACGDDTADCPVVPDASAGARDSSVAHEADAAKGASDAADSAASVSTQSIGSTGEIRITDEYVSASFHEDDTILRSSAAPDCVAHIRSKTKLFSPAGTVTIAGTSPDGGAGDVFVMPPDQATGYFYEAGGFVFPPSGDFQVKLSMSRTATFPAIAVQSLPTPPASSIVLTTPARPDSGPLVIASTSAFEVAWNVPVGANPNHRVGLRFNEFDSVDGSKKATLYCSFALSAGSGSIPSHLLTEIKSAAGAGATGLVSIHVGAQKEVADNGASYAVAVLRPTTTPLEINGKLQ
jgi:hypothetical protein